MEIPAELVKLLVAFAFMSSPYDQRHGKDEPHFTVRVYTPDGQLVGRPRDTKVPMSAVDDLVLAMDEIRKRRWDELKEDGWSRQISADHAIKRPEAFVRTPTLEDVRSWYAEAAAQAEQPDDIGLLLGEE